jgi:hypothetical protein
MDLPGLGLFLSLFQPFRKRSRAAKGHRRAKYYGKVYEA